MRTNGKARGVERLHVAPAHHHVPRDVDVVEALPQLFENAEAVGVHERLQMRLKTPCVVELR